MKNKQSENLADVVFNTNTPPISLMSGKSDRTYFWHPSKPHFPKVKNSHERNEAGLNLKIPHIKSY